MHYDKDEAAFDGELAKKRCVFLLEHAPLFHPGLSYTLRLMGAVVDFASTTTLR